MGSRLGANRYRTRTNIKTNNHHLTLGDAISQSVLGDKKKRSCEGQCLCCKGTEGVAAWKWGCINLRSGANEVAKGKYRTRGLVFSVFLMLFRLLRYILNEV